MNKFNFFSSSSILFPFRWIITIGLAVLLGLAYTDMTGYRFFNSFGQQQWAPGGPGGYHK
jgi:hypothetical protein